MGSAVTALVLVSSGEDGRAGLESEPCPALTACWLVSEKCPTQYVWNHIHPSPPQMSFQLSLPGVSQEGQASPCGFALSFVFSPRPVTLWLVLQLIVTPGPSWNTPLKKNVSSPGDFFLLFLERDCQNVTYLAPGGEKH